ncbi:asparagine synthase (glutamine-hydrolyzing) [Propionicicella superfundia]|uniref:asparagine synthase (glutamine-hydrolyzing) n=1 Tax=Propionicicella superfundia TaxID=348582 RepID=UPI00040A6785|nr:asparagine synthase (glutamine-hydrolyzing) [Propionicicella superfundia]
MCGWVGYVHDETDLGAQQGLIEAMADTIAHRGPDDDSYYVDGGVALGFRRLSIIDLAGGRQPMTNEDDTLVLVFNGEIYNFQELRTDLVARGHTFKTASDSEVILHGYEEYGPEICNRLRGMFAFLIWDAAEKKLFGARDVFGIKPVYYYHHDDTFLVGSEIKSFLPHPAFVKQVNTRRLPEYLSFEYIPDRETMFVDVFKLLAGEYFTYSDGVLSVTRYFDYEFAPDDEPGMDDWVDRIADTFSESVRAHKISDVEVGCFLSSGVDSSYATNELAKIQAVTSFSVGYEEEKYSELSYAQDFSDVIGVENVANKISADDFFGSAGTIQYHMDEPLPNPSAVPLYFLAKNAARHVKVVLSGEGADELFGGYNGYTEPLNYAPYEKVVPARVRAAIARVVSKLPAFHGQRFLMRSAEPIEERFFRHEYNFTVAEREDILAERIPAHRPSYYTKPYFDRVAGFDDVTKMQYVDFYTWMLHDILLKADKMSMASSLELRVPFLDREVLKVALRIPTKYRVQKDSTKAALRKAALREIPERTANKPKLGFPVPLNDWLRQERYAAQVRGAFASPEAAMFFQQDKILTLLDDHVAGKAQNMKKIWSVYSFLLWYDEYFVRR